jgi:hypothetical protein
MTQDHAEFLAFCKTVIHLEATEDIALACWVESRNRALEEAARVCDAQAEDAVAPKRLALMTAVGQTIQEGMYGGAKSCAGVIRNLK